MTEWVFVLLLHAATFGGPFAVEFHTQTEDGCQRLQKVVTREIDKMSLKYNLVECRVVTFTYPT